MRVQKDIFEKIAKRKRERKRHAHTILRNLIKQATGSVHTTKISFIKLTHTISHRGSCYRALWYPYTILSLHTSIESPKNILKNRIEGPNDRKPILQLVKYQHAELRAML